MISMQTLPNVRKLAGMFSICFLIAISGCATEPPGPVVDNTQLESDLASGQLVLLKFGAKWCGPCRMVDEELGALAEKQPQLKIIQIDVDSNENLAREFKVSGIPNMLLVRNKEILSREIGYKSAEELSDWVQSFNDQSL